MVSDIRSGRVAAVAAAITAIAAALQGCTTFGATEELSDIAGPAGGEGSAETAQPPPPTSTAPSGPTLPTSIEFGDIPCNADVPAQTVILPAVQTGSMPWVAGLEGNVFTAFPIEGRLAQGEERITVTPVKRATLDLTPIQSKLTVNINALSQIVFLRMQPRGGIVTFATDDLNLGKVYGTGTARKVTKVSNTGNAAVTVDITSSNTSISITPKTLTLAPAQSADLTIELNKIGAHEGSAVVVVKNGALCGATKLDFRGEQTYQDDWGE